MADDLGHEATPLAARAGPARLSGCRSSAGLPAPIDPPTIPTETRRTGCGERGRQVLLTQTRTRLAPCASRPVMLAKRTSGLLNTPSGGIGRALLRPPRRLATIDHQQRLWVRGAQSSNRDHPRARRPSNHRPSRTSLGPAERNRDPTIRDFTPKNWKRARLPTIPLRPIGTGVAIAVRILATECPLLGRTGHARMAGMT